LILFVRAELIPEDDLRNWRLFVLVW